MPKPVLLRRNGIPLTLSKRKKNIDLLIASTAKYYDMTLVANDKHMRHLPVSFTRENWAMEAVNIP